MWKLKKELLKDKCVLWYGNNFIVKKEQTKMKIFMTYIMLTILTFGFGWHMGIEWGSEKYDTRCKNKVYEKSLGGKKEGLNDKC